MGLLERLAPHLPYMRRYARALTGGQEQGDVYVRSTLEALAAGGVELRPELTPRVAFYNAFHKILAADAVPDRLPMNVNARLSLIAPESRAAHLLTALEGFNEREAAQVLDLPLEEVRSRIAAAQAVVATVLKTNVFDY